METNNTRMEIKPYTMGELCAIYQVTNKTMNTWIRPHAVAIGKRQGWYYTAKQVKAIVDCIGYPTTLDDAL